MIFWNSVFYLLLLAPCVIASEPKRFSLQPGKGSEHWKVEGPIEDVLLFLDTWQDAIYPEWREVPELSAKINNVRKVVIKQGEGRIPSPGMDWWKLRAIDIGMRAVETKHAKDYFMRFQNND